MCMKTMSRRNFLRGAAGVACSLALLRLDGLPPARAAARTRRVSEIPASAEEIAKDAPLIEENWQQLTAYKDSIENATLRTQVAGVLENPAPTFLTQYGTGDAARVYEELRARGLIDAAKVDTAHLLPPIRDARKSPQPFRTAPGSGYASHHPYPGGLVTHTTANVSILLGIYETYQKVFGYRVDRDIAVAAEILHDLAKPYVFAWQADGSSQKEYPIAGQGAHHVLSLAESIYRGLPPEVVVAQACAHDHPGSDADAKQVESWLLAASILAGKDIAAYGLLTADGRLRPPVREEGFLVHLGDHDWVLSSYAASQCTAYLSRYATDRLGILKDDTKTIHAVRNYVGAQLGYLRLYAALTESEAAADALTKSVLTK